jgi:hypothetical protein
MKNLPFIFILFSLLFGLILKSSAQDKSAMDTLYVSESSALSHSYRERVIVVAKTEKKHFKAWIERWHHLNSGILKKPSRERESRAARVSGDSARITQKPLY